MPRAVWSGAIAFGLVHIPVKVVTATSSKDVRFHQLHEKDGARIRYRKVCENEDKEVPSDEIVRGYEISRDHYVVMEDEELEAAAPEAARVIEISDFVKMPSIDPVYLVTPYYLVPDPAAARAYRLLHDALVATGRAGIGRVAMRGREHLVALTPRGDAIVMETMRFGDEVLPPGTALEDVTAAKAPTTKEMAMAKRLINELAADFDPAKYEDTYRERVLALIGKKAEGQKIVVRRAVGKREAPKDLVKALEESLKAAKKAGA